jgi:HSP20 family molecular chaperone IbpA
MEDIRNIYWRLLQIRVDDIAGEPMTVRVPSLRASRGWCPAINLYRYRDVIVLCMDLAGVQGSDIQVSVESKRIIIRGRRQSSEPDDATGRPLQVLALEIDFGPFEREVMLPLEVDPEGVETEQHGGLFWISLPLQSPE